MKNVHLVSVSNQSKLLTISNRLTLVRSDFFSAQYIKLHGYQPKAIYITSEEKFVRDEYITDGLEVTKATPKLVDAQGLIDRRDWKKIILTTDVDLIADGVQAIDDEFLEWFMKNPSCESVKVEKDKVFTKYDNKLDLLGSVYIIYKIIIPQEEPKREFVNKTSKRIDDELLEMERKQHGYSEEEVKEKTLLAMIEIMQEYSIIKESSVVQFHEAWFNQIKKGED